MYKIKYKLVKVVLHEFLFFFDHSCALMVSIVIFFFFLKSFLHSIDSFTATGEFTCIKNESHVFWFSR